MLYSCQRPTLVWEDIGWVCRWGFCSWSLPWYYYAHWLPVHIRDILNLHKKHPDIYNDDVVRSIMCAHEEGKKQHSASVKEHQESQSVAFNEPIKKFSFPAINATNNLLIAQKMICTYWANYNISCRSEKAMLTTCLKSRILTSHHLHQNMASWEWPEVWCGSMLGSRVSLRLQWGWCESCQWCQYGTFFEARQKQKNINFMTMLKKSDSLHQEACCHC